MKTINFISGLPRSGSTLITNILKQNPNIHGESVSTLSSVFHNVNYTWDMFEQSLEYPNNIAKKNVLSAIVNNYYNHINKSTIFDRDLKWISLLPILETVLDKKVKILVCVRNPAEILTSYEKLRKDNPLFVTKVDQVLKNNSSIASRCFYYSSNEGVLGIAHRQLSDAITMGYIDRFLFVDYNKFCNTPKAQTKRIYDFFELPHYEHNFQKIDQEEKYIDSAVGLPDYHKIKPELNRTTVNCVEYLGLDLYEQYNRQIFWNAWI